MRKTLVILIIATAFLVSFVESKEIRKQNPDATKGIPILIGSELENSDSSPTYYTKDNTACFNACQANYGNSLYYYYYYKYLCCALGLSGSSDGWYYMSCYPMVLNC